MASYKYIGNHDSIRMYDIDFRRNSPVDVTGKYVTLRKSFARPGGGRESKEVKIYVDDKLRGNSHFEQCEDVIEAEFEEIVESKRRGRPRGNQSPSKKQSLEKA